MRLEITAVYRARVRRKRAREFKDEYFRTVVPVTVEESPASAVPLAARCAVVVANEYDAHDRSKTVVKEYRLRDGILLHQPQWAEAESVGREWLAQFAAPEAGIGCARRRGDPFDGLGERVSVCHPPYEECAGLFSELGESNRELVETAVLRKASEIVLVDGAVWVASAEPVIAIDYARNRDERAMRIVAHVVEKTPSFKGDYYRLDQGAFARDRLEAVKSALWDIQAVEMPDIEVLDGSGFKLEPERELLLGSAARLVADMRSRLDERPLEWLVAYGELRDIVAKIGEDASAASVVDVDRLVEAAERAGAVFDGNTGVTGYVKRLRDWNEAVAEEADLLRL